jgi:lipopolysaccharide export system protein LptA
MRPHSFLATAAALILVSAVAAADVPASDAPTADVPSTTVSCAGLTEITSTDTETTAIFHDQVLAVGNGITLTCDYLKVIASRIGDKTATIGKYGKFKYLLATGNVKITQEDRIATGGRAEVYPDEDRIVMTENPVVQIESEHYTATGPRMILYRGQRRAVIEGTPAQRSTILLPAIKDLGYPAEKNPEPTPTGPAKIEPQFQGQPVK